VTSDAETAFVYPDQFRWSVEVLAWLSSWLDVSAGETLGALGSVAGGIIGALGSAAAVFLMLRRQRADEIEKVSAAVLSEVAELCKSPIGQLNACAQIQMGQITCPVSQLKNLFQSPVPVIFPAIANMVSRLPSAALVVSFYSQLQETRGLLAVTESASRPEEIVTGGHIKMLADLTISQCQLARFILQRGNDERADQGTVAGQQRTRMLKVLDEQLAAAKQVFPNADSFLDQQLPIGIFRGDCK
jgi:hypothetical protein